jgi:hypothetical protein
MNSSAVGSPEPLSATADLLEALRRKRTDREATDLEAHPQTSQIRVVDIEVQPIEQSVEKSAEEAGTVIAEPAMPEPEAATSPKKGRAAMPSWDEIVFGTKADE